MAFFNNEQEKSGKSSEPAAKPPIQLTPQDVSPPTPAPARTVEQPARGTSPAYLDQGTKINGKLTFEGAARIDGQVEGEIKGKEVTIGESAVVSAQIKADSVVISGSVKGEITASQRIEIQPSAKVTGNITAPKIIILEGAAFEGQCAMGREAPREERKPVSHNGTAPENRPQA